MTMVNSQEHITQSLKKHFNNISSAYYNLVDRNKHSAGYCHKSELRFVLENISSRKKRLILDAGCGPGRHAVSLAASGHKVIALDFAFNMIKETLSAARQRNVSGDLRAVNADVRALSFKDNSFDIIVNAEVLEHLPGYLEDVLICVKEFYRILKPGGALLIEAPLRLHYYFGKLSLLYPWNWFNSCWRGKGVSQDEFIRYYKERPLEVDNLFRQSEVEGILKEAGFSILRRKYIQVLQAGWFKRFPFLCYFDRCVLGNLPVFKRAAREVVWFAQKTGGGIDE